ncbi:hypothetical protein [Encephalitozoon cuniculi GB-M1]|uniref:Uncharacterized protein n=1 Tax=Encephalitozoon cuniculi (strain GB-M1) TaxID=284813 RepID=Q8SW32_ENCCU|nr:uncharacterized protein ECU03_0970 [Encephalitozoon cuniculi GB-M1]CAD26241.1 hypothetical protein [Encephalitozoon cuniculi GB-M1]
MEETESEDISPGIQARKRRRRLAARLALEMELIKKEFERPSALKNAPAFLCDFEKHLPFSRKEEIRYACIPDKRGLEKAADEAEKVKMVAEYAAEAGVLMVIDVLRQSRKVVFGRDWEIGYRENNIINILRKIERKRRRKGLLRDPERCRVSMAGVQRVWREMMGAEQEKRKILGLVGHEVTLSARKRVIRINDISWDSDQSGSDGVLCTMMRTAKIFPGSGVSYEHVMLPSVGDDDPPPLFNTKAHAFPRKAEDTSPKIQMVETYKKYLGNFSKLSAQRSSRNNLVTMQTSLGSHPTSQHIFKKISMEYLRCKSARDIVSHKYRHVIINREAHMAKREETKYSTGRLEDDSPGDLCSSGSDDTSVGYTFLIEAALGKVCSLDSEKNGEAGANAKGISIDGQNGRTQSDSIEAQMQGSQCNSEGLDGGDVQTASKDSFNGGVCDSRVEKPPEDPLDGGRVASGHSAPDDKG